MKGYIAVLNGVKKIIYLLKCSKIILFVNFFVTFLILLFCEKYVKGFYYLNEPPYYMKEDYIGIKNDLNYKEISELQNSLEQKSDDLIFESITQNNVLLLYYKNIIPDIDIIEGRSIEKEDFEKQSNVLLVSKEYKKFCEIREEKFYYNFMGKEYQVVGIYEKQSNIFYKDINVIINMEALNLENNEESVLNEQYISSKTNIDDILKKYNINYLKKYKNYKINLKIKLINKYYDISMKNYFYLIIVMILCLFNLIINWNYDRRDEFIVKKYVGCSSAKLKREITIDYFMIINLTFIVATFSYFIYKVIKDSKLLYIKIYLQNIIVCYFILFIIQMILVVMVEYIFDDWIEDNL